METIHHKYLHYFCGLCFNKEKEPPKSQRHPLLKPIKPLTPQTGPVLPPPCCSSKHTPNSEQPEQFQVPDIESSILLKHPLNQSPPKTCDSDSELENDELAEILRHTPNSEQPEQFQVPDIESLNLFTHPLNPLLPKTCGNEFEEEDMELIELCRHIDSHHTQQDPSKLEKNLNSDDDDETNSDDDEAVVISSELSKRLTITLESTNLCCKQLS